MYNIFIIITVVLVFIIGFLIHKLEQMKTRVFIYKEELKDFSELLTLRNRIFEEQLANLNEWVVEKFPEEMVKCIVEDQNIIEMKDKLLLKDEDFYLQFKSSLIKIQESVATKLSDTYKNFFHRNYIEAKNAFSKSN